jgi:hypothetical protein
VATSHLTTGELFEHYGGAVPIWQIRRLIDALGEDIPRAGQYRLVPRAMLARIEDELRRRSLLPETASTQEAVRV